MKRPECTDVAEAIEIEVDLMMATEEVQDAPAVVIMRTIEVIHMAIHVTQIPSQAMSVLEVEDTALRDRRMARETDVLRRVKMEANRTAVLALHQGMRSALRR